MSTASVPVSMERSKALRAVFWGGLMAGVLDISAAFVQWSLQGVSPIRILQAVASGLLSADSFNGGLGTAVLGALLHFLIAFGAAGVYYAASRKLGFMVRRALVSGALYGVMVYAFMQFVVLPLSAFRGSRLTFASVVTGLIIHILFVGLPISLAVSRLS